MSEIKFLSDYLGLCALYTWFFIEIVWSTATHWISVFLLMGMLEPMATNLFPILDITTILQFAMLQDLQSGLGFEILTILV